MSDLLKKLGRRIKELRTKRGCSQEHLAELSSISGKYVGDMERGEANASILVLERVAGALGVSVQDLLEVEHEGRREELVEQIELFLLQCNHAELKNIFRLLKSVGL